MDQKKQQVTGIILAGGSSTRMGTEKGLVEFNGRPMIGYAIDALKTVCNQILISGNPELYQNFGFPVITDERQDSGPMGGIWSCMKHAKNELCFVLSCDMPLVDHSAVSAILEEAPDFDAVVPWHGGNKYEPLCAVYRKNLLPEFESFIRSSNFRIPDLINQVNSRKIEVGAKVLPDAGVFFNVNSPTDLEQLSKGSTENEKPEKPGLPEIPNLLMIAGTGRKVGKTTLACRVIEKCAATLPVTAVKISPHLHRQSPGQKIIAETKEFQIIEESNPHGTKDSSRMMKAGAVRVFYVQTRDRNIREPFEQILKLIPKDQPVVCESGALLNHAKPGLFVLIKRDGQTAFKKGLDQINYEPDEWITFFGDGFSVDPGDFVFENNRWKMKTQNS